LGAILGRIYLRGGCLGFTSLGTRFFDLIEDGRIDDRGGVAINTLGEALQAAKADLAVTAPEVVESNYSITLLGVPAMRVR